MEGAVVSTEAADIERDLRPRARRYLGREMGDRYVKERETYPRMPRRAHPHASGTMADCRLLEGRRLRVTSGYPNSHRIT